MSPKAFVRSRPPAGTTQPVAFRMRIQMDRREVDKWVSRTPNQINDALWDAAPEIGEMYVKAIRPYPPPIPDSKYVRTGNLMRGWWYERRHTGKGEVTINVTNKMPYTKWVKDGRFQARIHVGRHTTVQQVNEQLGRRAQGVWQRHLRAKVKT